MTADAEPAEAPEFDDSLKLPFLPTDEAPFPPTICEVCGDPIPSGFGIYHEPSGSSVGMMVHYLCGVIRLFPDTDELFEQDRAALRKLWSTPSEACYSVYSDADWDSDPIKDI